MEQNTVTVYLPEPCEACSGGYHYVYHCDGPCPLWQKVRVVINPRIAESPGWEWRTQDATPVYYCPFCGSGEFISIGMFRIPDHENHRCGQCSRLFVVLEVQRPHPASDKPPRDGDAP